MDKSNNLIKVDKWLKLVVSLCVIVTLVVGAVAGMAIKSQKINDAYSIAKENEKSIYELREMLIRIDTNMEFVKNQIIEMKEK